MHIKSLDHSDTSGNPKAKYDYAALIYLMAGSLMLRHCLHWLFYWQEANKQKCWAKQKVHKIRPRHEKRLEMALQFIQFTVHAVQSYQKRLWLKLSINNISKALYYNGISNWVLV